MTIMSLNPPILAVCEITDNMCFLIVILQEYKNKKIRIHQSFPFLHYDFSVQCIAK